MDDVKNCPVCTARLWTITSHDSMMGRACSMRAIVQNNFTVRYEIGEVTECEITVVYATKVGVNNSLNLIVSIPLCTYTNFIKLCRLYATNKKWLQIVTTG